MLNSPMVADTLTAHSVTIVDTLENLIAPGGRARLSPYVEIAQFLTLFNELPSPKDRTRVINRLIRERQDKVQSLAKEWADFCLGGKSFRNNTYSEKNFLEAYLVYYFSVNVAKVQITLLDLLREGEFRDPHLEFVDIGVGTGTSIIALLDFLWTWKTICDLYSVEFPIRSLALYGLDRSQAALDFASLVVKNYAQALRQRAEFHRDDFMDLLINAAESTQWLPFDLETSDQLPLGISPTLLITSNVINELGAKGKDNLSRLVCKLPENAIALFLEPGSEKEATFLMNWRNNLLMQGGFSRTGPCGQEILENRRDRCPGCWNVRRHSFHQTALFLEFRKLAQQFVQDQRSLENYENNLLSWSSAWVKRGQRSSLESMSLNENHDQDGQIAKLFRFVGRYRNNQPLAPVTKNTAENSNWVEIYKLCPVGADASPYLLERRPGFVIPPLRHGQLVELTHEESIVRNNGHVVIRADKNTHVKPIEDWGNERSFLPEYSERTRLAVDEVAYRLFGFEGMRPFQHKILSRVLTGKSILGIAATGSGKSECFILPAMILPGVTVVVSPLVSLMMDQYDQRISERYGLDGLVTYINGEVPFEERQVRLQRMVLGYYKMVYFTPEQLERSYILDALRMANQRIGVRYLAMDEAHCISQWGHDFRPSYLNICHRMKDYGLNPVRIALTATASPYVRVDICEELGLDSRLLDDGGDVYVESSNRPELNLIVRVMRDTDQKAHAILADLQKLLRENQNNNNPGAAIVFMPITGGDPDSVFPTSGWGPERGKRSAGVTHFASFLERTLGQRVAIYHSKMDMDMDEGEIEDNTRELGDLRGRRRRTEQQRFISGEVPIMVATKGFGMGIDKDNIRLVIHRTPPSNLEAYAQEAGRAGRDGNLADVILYYSPDTPEEDNGYGKKISEWSDYDIQAFFLNEKYIRREDVLVMRAFLNTVKHKVGNALYFTNDEALEFFNRCVANPSLANLNTQYRWPVFPPRRSFGVESEEHKEILDRGHEYQCQTAYIDRILQVLYRIRPELPGVGKKCAFLEQVHETGAVIKNPLVLAPQAIIESNAYFGRILREKGVTAKELKEQIEKGELFDLAKRLGLSLRETSSLLHDIRSAQGNWVQKRWKPELLDFFGIFPPRFGPAANITTLSAWREYAGAYKRATKATAEKRAKDSKRSSPNLDDWFGLGEVNRPRGWEVVPGPAFELDRLFDRFLDAFMRLHDQRKENDWAAYHRMLRDYIGVDENGKIPAIKRADQQNCLRAVLLGYLETYEVVEGDNCYGCSRCVKDGDFSQYTVEQRRSAVIRMLPAISELFDRLKAQTNAIPSSEDTQRLFAFIRSEELMGRSLLGYFKGWSSRLLDQMPDHRTALWLRLEAMVDSLMDFDYQEFLHLVNTLSELLTNKEDLERLDQIAYKVPEEYHADPAYRALLADLARKLGDFKREANLLHQQIEALQDNPAQGTKWLYSAATRLIELHGPRGPIREAAKIPALRLIAGRTSETEKEAKKWYAPVVKKWEWTQIEHELREQTRYKSLPMAQSALCLEWAKEDVERWNNLALWISDNQESFELWSHESQVCALDHIPLEVLISNPNLGRQAIRMANKPDRVIPLGMKLYEAEVSLTPIEQKRLYELMVSSPQLALSCLKTVPSHVSYSLLRKISDNIEISSWENFETWLNFLPAELLSGEYALRWLEHGIRFSAEQEKSRIVVLKNLFTECLKYEHLTVPALAAWKDIALRDPEALTFLLNTADLLDQETILDLLHQIIAKKQIELLANLPADIKESHFSQAAYFTRVALKYKNLLTSIYRKAKIYTGDLLRIRNEFRWKTDPSHAEMVASIFQTITAWTNPNWLTPVALFVQALVYAGRVRMARQIKDQGDELTFSLDGRKVDFEEMVRLVNPIERDEPLPVEYTKILKAIVERK